MFYNPVINNKAENLKKIILLHKHSLFSIINCRSAMDYGPWAMGSRYITRIVVCSVALIAVLVPVHAQTKKAPVKAPVKTTIQTPVMKNLLDSFSYAVGVNVANSMKQQGISSISSVMMHKGIEDVFKDRPLLLDHNEANTKIQEQVMKFQQVKAAEDIKKAAAEKAKAQAFFSENKKRNGVIALPNGMQYEVLTAGNANSVKAKATDSVTVHYRGTFLNGEEFDGSIGKEPITFSLGAVIRGWTEIIQMMPVGAKWKVYIPSDLAYGDAGRPGIPPGAPLVFEINLLDVKSPR